MDQVKKAFDKVKEDISSLTEYLYYLEKRVEKTESDMSKITAYLENIDSKLDNAFSSQNSQKRTYHPFSPSIHSSTHQQPFSADTQQTDTPKNETSTHNSLFRLSEGQIYPFSTGNRGVPTDRQTDRQTDRHPFISDKTSHNHTEFRHGQDFQMKKSDTPDLSNSQDTFKDASKILDSLDSFKKELRLKFKRLTEQEFLIFSTLYQIEEEIGHTEYRMIAEKLGLTESSIRDYVGRIIKKGVPIEKEKINNKAIRLRLSQDIKKIASLQTIMQLRGL